MGGWTTVIVLFGLAFFGNQQSFTWKLINSFCLIESKLVKYNFILLLKSGLPRQINGFQTSLLIRHTRDDTAEEFRHHVLIFVKGVHVCSGSIVNGGLILTAAQCME